MDLNLYPIAPCAPLADGCPLWVSSLVASISGRLNQDKPKYARAARLRISSHDSAGSGKSASSAFVLVILYAYVHHPLTGELRYASEVGYYYPVTTSAIFRGLGSCGAPSRRGALLLMDPLRCSAELSNGVNTLNLDMRALTSAGLGTSERFVSGRAWGAYRGRCRKGVPPICNNGG